MKERPVPGELCDYRLALNETKGFRIHSQFIWPTLFACSDAYNGAMIKHDGHDVFLVVSYHPFKRYQQSSILNGCAYVINSSGTSGWVSISKITEKYY